MKQIFSIHPGCDADLESELKKIGHQHAQIFTMVGKFISMARSGAEIAWLSVLLERIIVLTLDHCQDEENLLRRRRNSGLSKQKEDHYHIVHELERSHAKMENARSMSSEDYLHVFDSLIIHHHREEECGGLTLNG